jgi:hypothetical protein
MPYFRMAWRISPVNKALFVYQKYVANIDSFCAKILNMHGIMPESIMVNQHLNSAIICNEQRDSDWVAGNTLYYRFRLLNNRYKSWKEVIKCASSGDKMNGRYARFVKINDMYEITR